MPRSHVQLSIDSSIPYPFYRNALESPSSSDLSSTRASVGASSFSTTSPSTPSTAGDWVLFSVLCLFDFDSSDPDHLCFTKNEILDIVKQESSGWWAAVHADGTNVGWIPSTYVQPLKDEMTESLRSIDEEIRILKFESLYHCHDHPPEGHWVLMDKDHSLATTPTDTTLRCDLTSDSSDHGTSTSPIDSSRLRPPPSPTTPMPHPPNPLKPFPLLLNKPTPPTPTRSASVGAPIGSKTCGELFRSHSDSASNILNIGRNIRRRPLLVDDAASLSRLSMLVESKNTETTNFISSEPPGEGLQNAKLTQAHPPWYLRPSYTPQSIKINFDGSVKGGTLPALVERLTSEPFKKAQDATFRNAFLMTFRTFATADQIFDLLVEQYQMDHPAQLTDVEFEHWKDAKLRPTQERVLTVFTMWLEDHRLLEEEPHIAQKLTDFLSLIVTPVSLAITAKLIQESLERLTFAHPNPSQTLSPRRRRRSKTHRNELLRFDTADIAEQLCFLEHRLYAKISPQECINWATTHTGPTVTNLVVFCSTHDKLVGWVKTSVLTLEVLSKRADTIDFWIKVAEKCRNLNNFSSTSAILTALSSTVITRLHLTWAHTSRRSHLEPLLKLNEPGGGFAAYRNLIHSADGPCIPLLAMYLIDISHLHDQLGDTMRSDNLDGPPLICFQKRQRWYDIVVTMLRSQKKPYHLAENDWTCKFIEGHLRSISAKEQTWYWQRSQELQQMEIAHANIRKGLEAAGF